MMIASQNPSTAFHEELSSAEEPKPELPLPPEFAQGLIDEINGGLSDKTVIAPINGDSNAFGIRSERLPFVPPPSRPMQEYFKVNQKWEGYVTWVGHDSFGARLVPIIGEGPEQEADIYLEEVDEEDRHLVEPGAIFYWSIGYYQANHGRMGASIIRYRRLPRLTQAE
jgi:hypothetical protein